MLKGALKTQLIAIVLAIIADLPRKQGAAAESSCPDQPIQPARTHRLAIRATTAEGPTQADVRPGVRMDTEGRRDQEFGGGDVRRPWYF